MRIGIDGRVFNGDKTGVGRYVFEICRYLDQLLPDARFFVYSQSTVKLPVCSNRWISRVEHRPLGRWIKSTLWLKVCCGSMCQQDDLDIFWGGGSFLPQLGGNVKTVITVHDLNYLIVPKTMSFFHYIAFKLFFAHDVKRSDYIVTNSKGTANKLEFFFGCDVDAIVYPSINPIFHNQGKTTEEQVKKKFGLKSRFFLSVGSNEPRKNIKSLIKAFDDLKRDARFKDYELVLVGSKGWKNRDVMRQLKKMVSVKHLGYIEDIDLSALYSSSAAFVFPSIYEGFGIPVIEARSCGAFVVTTDIEEIREAGDEKTIYIDASVEGIKRGLFMALSRNSIDLAFSKKYPSWQDGAKTMAKIFNIMISQEN